MVDNAFLVKGNLRIFIKIFYFRISRSMWWMIWPLQYYVTFVYTAFCRVTRTLARRSRKHLYRGLVAINGKASQWLGHSLTDHILSAVSLTMEDPGLVTDVIWCGRGCRATAPCPLVPAATRPSRQPEPGRTERGQRARIKPWLKIGL